MRLEYTEEQEKQLRITEIEAILENNLREGKVDIALEVELQFLQGNQNVFGEHMANVVIDTGETLEIVFDELMKKFSMLVYDKEGNAKLPYYNADTVEELLEYFEEKKKNDAAVSSKIEKYKESIRKLKQRIDKLLEVGNACLENNIPIEVSTFPSRESYDTHQFVSNGWSHLVGFIIERDPDTKIQLPLTKVGKIGGGVRNYNLTTDGINIDVSGNVEYVLKKFLDDFDTFETEFYKYVDTVTGQDANSDEEITEEEKKQIEREVRRILQMSVGDDYSSDILNQYDETSEETFLEAVTSDVMTSSAWEEEKTFNEDDIRLAIGRELISRLGISI